MEILEIQIHGPFNLGRNESENILLNSIGKEKGIYLWTIPFEDKYLVHYVGETGVSFAFRTMEHIRNYLQGQYGLYEPEEFAKGRKIQLWSGMWKERRNNPSVLNQFLQRYPEFSTKYSDFLALLRFFLAPVESSQRIRQRIESAIAGYFYNQPGIVGTFQDEEIRYLPRRPDEIPILLKIRCSEQIIAMPTELTI
jgi:hypothetical protein